MKKQRSLSPWACSMMVAVIGTGSLHAGGPAIGATGINGPTVAVSTGSAHVSAPAVSHSTGVSHAGTVGVSHANNSLRPMTVTSGGPPHYLPGATTHAPGSNTVAGRGTTVPAMVQPATVPAARNAPVSPASRVRNAWTDVPSAQGQNNFTGTVLYPDAYHDAFGNPYPSNRGNSGASYGRPYRFHFHRRGYYNPYAYNDAGVLVGGYSPSLYGDTAGIADPASDFAADAPTGTVGESNQPSPAAVNDPSRPYPNGQFALTPSPGDSSANPQPPDDSPQTPANQNAQSNTGPDSLVEAVQAELSRRGYFGGKIDAIYNAATHAAIQRFQTDQHLPGSGRINEATLHALQLD